MFHSYAKALSPLIDNNLVTANDIFTAAIEDINQVKIDEFSLNNPQRDCKQNLIGAIKGLQAQVKINLEKDEISKKKAKAIAADIKKMTESFLNISSGQEENPGEYRQRKSEVLKAIHNLRHKDYDSWPLGVRVAVGVLIGAAIAFSLMFGLGYILFGLAAAKAAKATATVLYSIAGGYIGGLSQIAREPNEIKEKKEIATVCDAAENFLKVTARPRNGR